MLEWHLNRVVKKGMPFEQNLHEVRDQATESRGGDTLFQEKEMARRVWPGEFAERIAKGIKFRVNFKLKKNSKDIEGEIGSGQATRKF